MTSYISGSQIAQWAAAGSTVNKVDLGFAEAAALTACLSVDAHCRRNFDPITDETVASARSFVPDGDLVVVDDIATISDLEVSDNGSTVASDGYVLIPRNGIGPDGRDGWPYTQIMLATGSCWATDGARATVTVTAKWGWAATPAPIISAAQLLGTDLLASKDTRFGAAGFGEFGIIRIRENSQAALLLDIYVRRERKVGVA